MPMQKNRRQFWRANFHSRIQLATDGHVCEADLYDISLKGALIKVPDHWPGKFGGHCQLRLNLSPEATIRMAATIAHIAGRRVGLRCDQMDVDSITHLRRLVALNSGDADLLDRELAALLADAAD